MPQSHAAYSRRFIDMLFNTQEEIDQRRFNVIRAETILQKCDPVVFLKRRSDFPEVFVLGQDNVEVIGIPCAKTLKHFFSLVELFNIAGGIYRKIGNWKAVFFQLLYDLSQFIKTP